METKTVIGKEAESFMLGGWLVSIAQTMFVFCLCLDGTVVWSCLCFDPTRSQNIPVWCWCSVKCSMFNQEPQGPTVRARPAPAVRDCFSPHFLEVLGRLWELSASHSCDIDWISGNLNSSEWWLLVELLWRCHLQRPKPGRSRCGPGKPSIWRGNSVQGFSFLVLPGIRSNKGLEFQSFFFLKQSKVKLNQASTISQTLCTDLNVLSHWGCREMGFESRSFELQAHV